MRTGANTVTECLDGEKLRSIFRELFPDAKMTEENDATLKLFSEEDNVCTDNYEVTSM